MMKTNMPMHMDYGMVKVLVKKTKILHPNTWSAEFTMKPFRKENGTMVYYTLL